MAVVSPKVSPSTDIGDLPPFFPPVIIDPGQPPAPLVTDPAPVAPATAPVSGVVVALVLVLILGALWL